MTIERSVLEALVVAFNGLDLPPHLRSALSLGLGGVVLLSRNVESLNQVRAVTELVHSLNRRAIVMVDEEGGAVSRLDSITGGGFPSAQALGFIDDTKLTRDLALMRGGYMRDCGIDLCLSPVADLRGSQENPVVGTRSFGHDPELVARHVEATVTGIRSAGVASCVKHFPGHGATAADSHESRAIATATKAEICSDHLVPFRSAVSAGAEAVMPGHIVVPEWDSHPTSISSVGISMLRSELDFDRLVICDALDMAGVGSGLGEATANTLAAGADLVLLGNREPDLSTLKSIVASVGESSDTAAGTQRLREASRRRAAFTLPPMTSSGETTDRRTEAARRAVTWAEDSVGGPVQVRTVVVAEPSWVRGLDVDHDLLRAVEVAFPTSRVTTETDRPGADLVVTIDSAFDPEQRALVGRLRSVEPSILVVETGILANDIDPPVIQLRGTSELSFHVLSKALDGISS